MNFALQEIDSEQLIVLLSVLERAENLEGLYFENNFSQLDDRDK